LSLRNSAQEAGEAHEMNAPRLIDEDFFGVDFIESEKKRRESKGRNVTLRRYVETILSLVLPAAP